jgi:hypothetical protein
MPAAAASRTSAPRPRAVLLGASNLIHGLPSALAAARRALGGGPIEALAATGHGRSYGAWSRAGFRGLPGILDSGLWRALDRGPAGGARTLALLTDVGNDIGYGQAPETVAAWVEECVARLAAAGAQTVMTRLPLETLRRLPPWRFRVVATLLFPGRRLEFDEILRRAEALDRRLLELADRDGCRVAALEPSWYRAYDAIHLRFRWLSTAWATAFGGCGEEGPGETDEPASEAPAAAATLPPADRLRVLRAMPERFTLAGVSFGRAQPAARLSDGSTLSLF